MSRCETYQEEITLELAIGDNGLESLGAACQEHIAECNVCAEYLEQELELNRALAEPTQLPPADLSELVMARISQEPVPETSLAWGERMAWAASGAAVMFLINNLPAASANFISRMQVSLSSASFSWQMPYSLSSASVAALAALLVAIQAVMVYQVRASRQ